MTRLHIVVDIPTILKIESLVNNWEDRYDLLPEIVYQVDLMSDDKNATIQGSHSKEAIVLLLSDNIEYNIQSYRNSILPVGITEGSTPQLNPDDFLEFIGLRSLSAEASPFDTWWIDAATQFDELKSTWAARKNQTSKSARDEETT